MLKKISPSADNTCDFDAQLQESYGLFISSLHICLNKKNYLDGEDITPNLSVIHIPQNKYYQKDQHPTQLNIQTISNNGSSKARK